MSSIRLSNADWQEGSQAGSVSNEDEQLPEGLSRNQFEKWHEEIKAQPAWRAEADRESDYCDGNQLDSDVLRKQAAVGMPPAIEPLIGPVMDSVLGMEAQHRTDWRVIPDSDHEGDEVAEALNHKLNTAERQSKADRACSNAFAGQSKVGVGWVEVSRDNNPFNYPYRCTSIPRNEIFWDWRGSHDVAGMDHRYRIRRKWTDKEQAKLLFPEHEALIEQASGGWSGFDTSFTSDGGKSTGLAMSGNSMPQSYGAVTTPLAGDTGTSYPMLAAYQSSERGSSLEEQEWRDTGNSRICLFEVWYRVWSRALVMKMPDGRVVEYNTEDEMHQMIVATGAVTPFYAVISKVRLSWWLGPHRLSDDPSPYRHNKFPYVPFWGKREDRTGVPFALIRGMMFMQDNINATTSKIRWGLSAVRTERTQGATVDDDNTVRAEVGRPDADIVLVKNFTKDQHVFKVTRDFELNTQQFQMLNDSRDGIKRVGGLNDAFFGAGGRSQSGVAVTNLAEESNKALADIYDNFRVSRSEVGELLLSLIIEDMIGKPETILIKGHSLKDDKPIHLNKSMVDEETGLSYLDNDVERTLLKVGLEDVPSTPSFKSQQLNAFSEVFKAAPERYQDALFPQLLNLMDVPNKQDAIKAVKEAAQNQTPEQIQEQIKQAVEQALTKAMVEAKTRELDLKEQLNNATIKNLVAAAVKTMTEAEFAAMQAGQAIATMPQIAPIADIVMKNAGYQPPTPGGVDPNFPTPAAEDAATASQPPVVDGNSVPPMQVRQNTSPQLPPVAASPLTGIETLRNDNLTNAQGHVLHRDKHGNHAYVGPNGEVTEVPHV